MRTAGAIDIGGTGTKIGVVREDGRILARALVPTSEGGNPGPLLDAIEKVLRPMLLDSAPRHGPVRGT